MAFKHEKVVKLRDRLTKEKEDIMRKDERERVDAEEAAKLRAVDSEKLKGSVVEFKQPKDAVYKISESLASKINTYQVI